MHCLPNSSVAAASSVHTGPCVVCPVVGVRTLCRCVPSDARRDPSSTDDLAGLEALAWRHWPIGHTCVIVFRTKTDARLFVSNEYLSC